MIKIVFLLLSVFVSAVTMAQFNDSTFHYINFTGSGSLNKTTDGTSYMFNNGAKFGYEKKKFALNSGVNWIYGEDQVKRTNNDYAAFVDIDVLKSHKPIYFWALANFEKSLSLKLLNRFQTGLGVGYQFKIAADKIIILSDGILYENSSLTDLDQYGRSHYQTYRNSFRLKYSFTFNDRFKISGNNFLQNSLSDKTDYIIRLNNSVALKLIGALSFVSSVSYNKLNLNGNENFLFNYGLSFERFF